MVVKFMIGENFLCELKSYLITLELQKSTLFVFDINNFILSFSKFFRCGAEATVN